MPSPTAARPLRALPRLEEAHFGDFRHAVLCELDREFAWGFKLAYLYTFAVPSIAEELHRSREISRHPRKRATDTRIVIYELLTAGFDDPRSHQLIRMLTHVHSRLTAVSPDDFQFVLLALLVVPIEYCNSFGRRRLTPHETRQAVAFFDRLGRRLDCDPLPASYRKCVAAFEHQLETRAAPSDAGSSLMRSTARALTSGVRRAVFYVGLSFTVSDLAVSSALNVPLCPVPKAFRPLVVKLARKAAGTSRDTFVPGEASSTYPQGYGVNEVGPTDTGSSKGPRGEQFHGPDAAAGGAGTDTPRGPR